MIASMPINTARALLRIAADSDVSRPYLNGFWIEPGGVAVATDGHAMLAVSGILVDFEGPAVFIARDALESFLKSAGKSPYDLVITRDALRCGPLSATYHAPESGDKSGLSLFPWRRVIPHAVTGAADYETKPGLDGTPGPRRYNCIDCRQVERVRVALGELKGKTGKSAPHAEYLMNGTSAAVFDTPENVLAILMPMRVGEGLTAESLTADCQRWAAMSDAPARTLKAAQEKPHG